MLRIFYYLLSIFCIFIFNTISALESDWSGIEEAKVRIISPISKTGDDSTIYIGLEYKLSDGWKTYWSSPGEGGYPQQIKWQESSNVSELKILWPHPKEFEILGFKSLGYEKEVIFPLKVKLIDNSLTTFLKFEVNYLVCKDICLPGNANLELLLPAGKGELTNNSFKIEKYLSSVPYEDEKITGLKILEASSVIYKNDSKITIKAYSNNSLLDPTIYLGDNIGLPIISPEYIFSTNRKNVTAIFNYKDYIIDNKNFDLSIFFNNNNITLKDTKKIYPKSKFNFFINNNNFLSIFFIAFIGGMILNFMPCVLPVLSIKLISIIKINQENSIFSVRKSFLITALGIIVSFLLIALFLIFLKSGGSSIGWGMQFQQPLFLMIISLILFLFALNLLDLYQINLPIFVNNIFVNHTNNKSSYYSDFFNGFFATLLATPCSAPFVGTAVSTAFTQSYLNMLGIFFFMGFGMASPYILGAFFPQILNILPKPGRWINILKYILATLLFGTVIWLGIILHNHFNSLFILISIILGTIIILSFKIINKFNFQIILLSILMFFSMNFIPQLKENKITIDRNWLDLTKVNINDLIVDETKIVFVDVTADWCATCQFNKINTINSELINNLFKKNHVIKVRGNWTKPNKKIEDYLNKYNKFGIPFNAIYSYSYPNGIILSEILSKNEIVKTLDLIKNND